MKTLYATLCLALLPGFALTQLAPTPSVAQSPGSGGAATSSATQADLGMPPSGANPPPSAAPPTTATPPAPATPPATATPPAPPPATATPPAPATPPASATPPATATPPTASGSTATSASGGSSAASSGSPSDADVLTFAYNLECLEGQFYSCAALGTPLDSSITGGGPAPSSCKKASLSSPVGTYAAELAREETAHVSFLYTALKNAGANPVCPAVNIDSAFEAAAEAAFMSSTPLSPTFDPYANDLFFLHGAFIFEDLGASAYLGAQKLLSNPDFRQYAGQVGNAESYHSAIIRTLLYQNLTATPAYGKTVNEITTAIVAALNSLAGGNTQLTYTLSNSAGSSLANVNSMGFVPVATPQQVLKVVTLGASAGNGGGFFPSNLVGNVRN